jgi:hypothetical protein
MEHVGSYPLLKVVRFFTAFVWTAGRRSSNQLFEQPAHLDRLLLQPGLLSLHNGTDVSKLVPFHEPLQPEQYVVSQEAAQG